MFSAFRLLRCEAAGGPVGGIEYKPHYARLWFAIKNTSPAHYLDNYLLSKWGIELDLATAFCYHYLSGASQPVNGVIPNVQADHQF